MQWVYLLVGVVLAVIFAVSLFFIDDTVAKVLVCIASGAGLIAAAIAFVRARISSASNPPV